MSAHFVTARTGAASPEASMTFPAGWPQVRIPPGHNLPFCRRPPLSWNRSRADGCSGTWPAVPATAPPLHGAPGEEPARDACKWWTPEGGVARNGGKMTERKLSATDAALRERITELSVHIPCGGLRGPLQRRSPAHPELSVRWQSCPDEDSLEKWGQGRLLVVRGRPRTTPWSIALGSSIVRSNAVVGHR